MPKPPQCRKFFLLADGEPLPPARVQRLKRGRFTVVLDGAANQARRHGWRPQLVCGDLDSATPRTLAHFARLGVEVLPLPDQNHTDLEKSLAWCVESGAQSIWVAQGLGQRLDHSLANLAALQHFHHPSRELVFFTKRERIRFLRNERIRLRGPAGRALALFPFPHCRATSRHLEYELQNLPLRLGRNASISNRALRAEVELRVKGDALVIEEWSEK